MTDADSLTTSTPLLTATLQALRDLRNLGIAGTTSPACVLLIETAGCPGSAHARRTMGTRPL